MFQDGRLQGITNFAIFTRPIPGVAAPAATPVPTVAPAVPTPEPTGPPKREPRFVAFYVDNENVMPMNRNRVINKVADWVYTYLKPPDQAMVVSYQRSLKVLQPFTSEPEAVAAALRVMKRYTGGATDANNSRRQVEEYIEQNSDQRRQRHPGDGPGAELRARAVQQPDLRRGGDQGAGGHDEWAAGEEGDHLRLRRVADDARLWSSSTRSRTSTATPVCFPRPATTMPPTSSAAS